MKAWFTRKRILFLGGAAVLTAIILIILAVCGAFGSNSPDKISKYTIKAEYNPETRILDASMTLDYINNSGATLNELVLMLFPNAFLSQESAPFESDCLSLAYPDGFSAGGIEVSDVTVSSKEAQPVLSDSKQRLTIPLGRSLGNGRSISISLKFTVTVPVADGRFGTIGPNVNLGNWYPIAAVNKDGQWQCIDYCKIGDPFYSGSADYNIELTAPSEYTFAGSAPTQKQEDGGKTVWRSEGKNLRDYAAVLGKAFKTDTVNYGDIAINCYYNENQEQAQHALKVAKAAITLFEELYGPYPYKEFNIIETAFFIGGMEYPGLVLIDTSYFENGNAHALENVVAHETAHQWWYGGVGNDQINEAWIDEGLATYSTMLYYERYKKHDTYRLYYKYYVTNGYRFSRDSARKRLDSFSEVINRPIDQFNDSMLYNMLCYEKSAMMLQSVRELLGDELFLSDLKELYSNNAGGTITKQDICETFSRNTSKPITPFIESWMAGTVHIP